MLLHLLGASRGTEWFLVWLKERRGGLLCIMETGNTQRQTSYLAVQWVSSMTLCMLTTWPADSHHCPRATWLKWLFKWLLSTSQNQQTMQNTLINFSNDVSIIICSAWKGQKQIGNPVFPKGRWRKGRGRAAYVILWLCGKEYSGK